MAAAVKRLVEHHLIHFPLMTQRYSAVAKNGSRPDMTLGDQEGMFILFFAAACLLYRRLIKR